MSQMRDRLYNLLPAIYRPRDELAGRALQALLAVIEHEFDLLETDLAAAYDNWFIETCDAWVIPYLADLVGIADQAIFEQPFFGQRRLVANHIAYQRRKGLVATLSHVARDVSGWHAHVVDLSQRVAQTQSMKNVKLSQGKTLDLRQGEEIALLGTAFDRAARTLDVRRVDADTQSGSLPGLVSFNALALYLWRLQSYPIRQAQAGIPAGIPEQYKHRCFTFDPLGRELPLFIQPEALNRFDEPEHPGNFPQPLTRAMLKADLTEKGLDVNQLDLLFGDEQNSSRYYGPQKEIAIWADGRLVPADEILCGQISDANMSYWDDLIGDLKQGGEQKTVVVDPESGRFFLDQAPDSDAVTVNYTYGFSHNLGSGPFVQGIPDEADVSIRQKAARIDILKGVKPHVSKAIQTVPSLDAALTRWEELCAEAGKEEPPQAIIRFLDSGTYQLSGPLQPSLPSGSYLSIEAAPGERPALILGDSSETTQASKEEGIIFDRHLRLQGLLVSVPVNLPEMSAGRLDFQIQGCTFLHGLELQISETVSFDLTISASIIESVEIKSNPQHSKWDQDKDFIQRGSLTIEDSVVRCDVTTILDSGQYVIETSIQRSTIFGRTELIKISQIKDSILMGHLTLDKKEVEQGMMQYSFVAETDLPETNCAYCITGAQVQPTFTSTQPVHPGYAQLRVTCPVEIRNGASNGAEMGVFNSKQENRREANLKHTLPDYLPLGQKIGLFRVT